MSATASIGTYPFGRPATRRPPRRPEHGDARLFVLGVYPSALHVHWDAPAWARSTLGIKGIGAVAVDDEPTVFWDGADGSARVDALRAAVGFADGDEDGCWGKVRPAGNGTSGVSAAAAVLQPLGVLPSEAWFTDALDRFFVKRATGGATRQQADAIDQEYAPFADALGLAKSSLPLRPSPDALVSQAESSHRDRLRQELTTANAPVVVTLGEEARRVLGAIADAVAGTPLQPLNAKLAADCDHYGMPGIVRVGGWTASWYALKHPGQRSPAWNAAHDQWSARVSGA